MADDPLREFIELLEQIQRDMEDAEHPVPHRRITIYRAHLQWLQERCPEPELAERACLTDQELARGPQTAATLVGLRAVCSRLARHDAVARERERTVMGEHVDALLLQAQRMAEAEEIEQVTARALARLDAHPVGEIERMHAASDLLEVAIASALRERT